MKTGTQPADGLLIANELRTLEKGQSFQEVVEGYPCAKRCTQTSVSHAYRTQWKSGLKIKGLHQETTREKRKAMLPFSHMGKVVVVFFFLITSTQKHIKQNVPPILKHQYQVLLKHGGLPLIQMTRFYYRLLFLLLYSIASLQKALCP